MAQHVMCALVVVAAAEEEEELEVLNMVQNKTADGLVHQGPGAETEETSHLRLATSHVRSVAVPQIELEEERDRTWLGVGVTI